MSINAMTNVSIARREDFEPPGGPPPTLEAMAAAAGQPPKPLQPVPADGGGSGGGGSGSGVNTALQTLTTYIPTEVLTLYVAANAALGSPGNSAGNDAAVGGPLWLFWAFLVVTPVLVWAVFAAKVRTSAQTPPPAIPWRPSQLPLFDMVAATVAYAAWAFALPRSPFASQTWYSSGLAGLGVVAVSAVLSLAAAIVVRRQLSS